MTDPAPKPIAPINVGLDVGHDEPFKLAPGEVCACIHCSNFRANIAPKPIADRIRDLANKYVLWAGTREPEDKEIYEAMLAIASELEEKAAEMREANTHHEMDSQIIEDWADSLAKRKDVTNERG
jgi:hypothetical protein